MKPIDTKPSYAQMALMTRMVYGNNPLRRNPSDANKIHNTISLLSKGVTIQMNMQMTQPIDVTTKWVFMKPNVCKKWCNFPQVFMVKTRYINKVHMTSTWCIVTTALVYLEDIVSGQNFKWVKFVKVENCAVEIWNCPDSRWICCC